MPRSRIRVFLVEDSPIALTIIKRILATSPEIEVVGEARTGTEALALIPACSPDVICTDLYMPQMNGVEFTREVMSKFPRPILVISAAVEEKDSDNVFQLLQAGAIDIFPKPGAGLPSDYEQAKQDLIGKIKLLSGVSVFTQHRRGRDGESCRDADLSRLGEGETGRLNSKRATHGTANKTQPPAPSPHAPNSLNVAPSSKSPAPKVVVIGASTGGPQALHAILTNLPPSLPAPVICIQHISEGFLQGLVDWLGKSCQMPVKIAPSFELPRPGNIYFAPEQRHLELDASGRFVYLNSPAVGGHRPSITVTFKSVAGFYGRSAVGILLTGMGRDGAEGMKAIAGVGGLTIAQDEASCVVFGMPREAIALGAAKYILPINAIAPRLLSRFGTSI